MFIGLLLFLLIVSSNLSHFKMLFYFIFLVHIGMTNMKIYGVFLMPLISVEYRGQNRGIMKLLATDNVYIPMYFFFFKFLLALKCEQKTIVKQKLLLNIPFDKMQLILTMKNRLSCTNTYYHFLKFEFLMAIGNILNIIIHL